MKMETISKILFRLGMVCVIGFWVFILIPDPYADMVLALSILLIGGVLVALASLLRNRTKADKFSIIKGRRIFKAGLIMSILAITMLVPWYWMSGQPLFQDYLLVSALFWMASIYAN